jgi:hypothetical protein
MTHGKLGNILRGDSRKVSDFLTFIDGREVDKSVNLTLFIQILVVLLF